jgi:hypothetical protein
VTSPFIVYWRAVGLPLSRAKGAFVDALPFSAVETILWIGLVCGAILGITAVTGRWARLKSRPRLFRLLCSGPVILILLAMGQGAFPLSLAPTAWRRPLAKAFPGEPLSYPAFHDEVRARETRLLREFRASEYESLTEEEALHGCDLALDDVLRRLGLPPGRTVRRIKVMGPLTSLLGLSYGGPAFHDPFLGELAMVKPVDLPSTRYWRLTGVCHETAHAKGFTREMDAEILTQLALSLSEDPRYRMLGDLMYLRKSGEKVHVPEYLRQELMEARRRQQETDKRQWAVRLLRKISEKIGFQNSGRKYGSRDPAEDWDPGHPFYSTVASLLPRLEKPER